MNLQYTLQDYALQLKNVPRTLVVSVASAVQKIMKTLYDVHFPDAENRRPGRNPECPDSDILAIGWLLEYITEDSENAGYPRLKAALKTVFRSLPERSRFNRRRRNLKLSDSVKYVDDDKRIPMWKKATWDNRTIYRSTCIWAI